MRKTITCLALATLCLALPMSASAGVIAHWSFDETANGATTFADSSGNGHTATVHDAGTNAWLDAEGKFTTGGGGLSTAGYEQTGNSAGYATVSNFDASLTQTDFTVATWYNTDSVNGNQALFSNWGTGLAFLIQPTGGRLYLGLRNTDNANIYGNYINGTGDLLQDTWQHIAVTWDRGTKTLTAYIDGTQVGSYTSGLTNVDIATPGQDYMIGRRESGNVLNGNLDEMWVFDQALTVDEIGNLITGNNIVVPEPATMSLLALGGIAMLRRKRK